MLNASKDQLCSKLCRHNIRTLAGCKYLGVFSKVLLCNPLEAGLNSVLRLLKNLLTHIHQTHLVSCLCCHLCVCVCVWGGGGGGGGELNKSDLGEHLNMLNQLLIVSF